ncbi:MAG: hypothetical protein LBO79_09800 [Zoogloeaceae bacterium]|nr:hypothetical protein [Zoogloeaceae bacterium]
MVSRTGIVLRTAFFFLVFAIIPGSLWAASDMEKSPSPGPAPSRIVSLDLCTDWLLARYVSRARIAALSPMHRNFADAGMAAVDLADWPVHANDPEQILRLQPDLVLVGAYNALLLRAYLERLGLRVEVLSLPRTLAEVDAHERRLFALLGIPAARLPARPLPARMETTRRLLLLSPNGVGTGRDTLEDAMLTHAGWRNYVTTPGYSRVDLEKIAADPPDAVLWAAPKGAAQSSLLIAHPLWRRLLPAGWRFHMDTWPWQCPGPWTWETIRLLRAWRERM